MPSQLKTKKTTSASASGTEMLAVAAYSANDGMWAPKMLNFSSEFVGSGR